MAEITGSPAMGRIIHFFVPTKDFKDRDNGTQYVRGLQYNLLEHNIQLRQKLEKWQLEKKIRIF